MSVRVCDDTDLIAEMDRLCFPQDSRLSRETLEGCRWATAEVDGETVGFVGYRPGDTQGGAFLERYGVLNSAGGRGVGKALLRWCVRDARRQGFHTLFTYVMYWNVASIRALVQSSFYPTHWGEGGVVWVGRTL